MGGIRMYLNNTYYYAAIYATEKEQKELFLEENKNKKRNHK